MPSRVGSAYSTPLGSVLLLTSEATKSLGGDFRGRPVSQILAESLVHRGLVRESSRHVVGEPNDPEPLTVTRRIFAADHTAHRAEVIFRAHLVARRHWPIRGSCHLRSPSVLGGSPRGR